MLRSSSSGRTQDGMWTCIDIHWAISECHNHPLRFCAAFTHIQHQGSLSSVTSPSANQQPAIHKSGTTGEVDRDWPVVFLCFYYIQYISVYIQPRYFYLLFRRVNGNNMNRVILHSVRPSFWKKRDFSQAARCGSTESGCEISVPWWLILADRGKMTSVWSRDRDTGDTSEVSIPRPFTRFGTFF